MQKLACRGLVAVLALFAFGAVSAAAQVGSTTATVRGQVTDDSNEPVSGAQVVVRNEATGAQRSALTDESGRYFVPLLSPGTYTITVESIGYRPIEQTGHQLSLSETRTVDLVLHTQAVELGELRVEGRATDIDTRQGGVAESVSEAQIEGLPTSGRDFTDFISLSGLISPQPEISTGGQFSIGGARTSGTNVQIDGADANNAFFGENRGSSRLPFMFSLEAIKEFQIITSGYDVEYGKFSGGLINAVTRSGTNEFEGRTFYFGRDAALTAANFDGRDPTEFNSHQFGGVVSGPLMRDKLHFFLSAEVQRRNQPIPALVSDRAGVPQSTIDEFLTIVETYGIDASGDSGILTETQDEEALFGRLDWTINREHRLTFRTNYTNFNNENDRISPIGNEARSMGGTFKDASLSAVAELNSILNDQGTLYNTLRVHYSDEKRPRPGHSLLPSAQVEVADNRRLTYGGNFFGILHANNLEESKIQVTNNLSWKLGDHTFKIGTDNIFAHTFNKFWLNGNGFFTFDGLDEFRNGEPSFFLRFVPAEPGTNLPATNPTAPIADFDTREHALYVQDEWQVNNRLLLALGLRYDYMNFADPAPELSYEGFRDLLAEEFGVSTADVPSDKNNLGPRISFTYDLDGEAGSVLRGGAGIFYGRVPAVLHGNVMSSAPNPLLAVTCILGATPEFSYGDWQDGDIPTNCHPDYRSDSGFFSGSGSQGFGIGIIGAPELSTWDPDLEFPRTSKANLGYERRLGDSWKAGVQAIFSRTTDNYTVKGLNIRPVNDQTIAAGNAFQTADGRPIHMSLDGFGGLLEAGDAANERQRGVTSRLSRLFHQTNDGVAQGWNLKFDVQGQPTENVQFAANYTYTRAFDNSSWGCCTAFGGLYNPPTAGDPNFLGGIGATETGTWGPSDFERRHVLVSNAIISLPADFRISFIYRVQSGNPFTPEVVGDINADGNAENDRPFLPDPGNVTGVQFGRVDGDGNVIAGSPGEELGAYREVVAANQCLQEHIGQIIPRNVCRNDSWHSLNVQAAKVLGTIGDQRAEVVVDLFNVLNGLGLDAGELMFKRSELLWAEGYDESTNEVIYSVDDRFGEELPIGSSQLQFQAQIGVRYIF